LFFRLAQCQQVKKADQSLRSASTKLPVSLASAAQVTVGRCAQQKALTSQWSPVAVSLRVHRVSLEAEWVGCFVQCKVKGESLWTLKVVFTSRHVANVPTAPSDRSFQRFPCPSTAPQQPDAAWKRTLACTNHPAALAVTPNMIQTSQGITQTKRNTAKHGPVGMHCLGKLQ
jgi:hypothetical protein